MSFLFAFGNLIGQEIRIKGSVINRSDKTSIPCVRMVLRDTRSNIIANTVFTDGDGKFIVSIFKNEYDTVIIHAETNRYVKTPTAPLGFLSSDQKYIILVKDSALKEYNFEMIPVSGELRFPSFLFSKNSSDFYDGSESHKEFDGTALESLDGMFRVLVDNPTIVIEVSAHCSHEEKDPDILAQQRANKVKELLVKKGIDPVRVVAKGYGIKKLKISDAMFVKAKTSAEKETLRQINRRAVFKILSWDYPAPQAPKDTTGKNRLRIAR